jgi:hypothetical protein
MIIFQRAKVQRIVNIRYPSPLNSVKWVRTRVNLTLHQPPHPLLVLLAWEHGAKVSKNPESPKSPGKITCLSGFQAGHTLGNVKIAEVRKKEEVESR